VVRHHPDLLSTLPEIIAISNYRTGGSMRAGPIVIRRSRRQARHHKQSVRRRSDIVANRSFRPVLAQRRETRTASPPVDRGRGRSLRAERSARARRARSTSLASGCSGWSWRVASGCGRRLTFVMRDGKQTYGDAPLERLLEWAATAVGIGAKVVEQQALHGDQGPWCLSIEHRYGMTEAVLRAPTPRIDASMIATAAAALEMAERHRLPAPRLIAADLRGRLRCRSSQRPHADDAAAANG